MGTHAEARRRQRFQFDWPAVLSGPEGRPAVPARAANLSSQGLYAIAGTGFRQGERLECTIEFPRHLFGASGAGLVLRCGVRVLRVERVDGDQYGLGCRIECSELRCDQA